MLIYNVLDLTKRICDGGFLDYEDDGKAAEDNLSDNLFYVDSLTQLRDDLRTSIRKVNTEDGIGGYAV